MSTLLYKLQDLLDFTRQADFLAPLLLRLYLFPVFWMAGTNKWNSFDNTVNWFGNPDWGLGLPMPTLMAKAEKVDKLHAICVICGEEASRTQRLVDGNPAKYNDPVVIVGASELYQARCRRHHEVPE